MWETTVALSGAVPSSSIIKTEPMLSSTAHGEIFTTSSSANTPLNSIYTTETFTIPAGGLTQEVLNNSIISISGNGAHIINGADLDLSKLQLILSKTKINIYLFILFLIITTNFLLNTVTRS